MDKNIVRDYRDCCSYTGTLFRIMMEKLFLTLKGVATRRIINPICIILALVVYTANKVILKHVTYGVLGMLCRCYLNDLICPLFFLGYCQMILLWIDKELRSLWQSLLLVMGCGLIWEYVAPLLNPRAVEDPLDLVCYFLGTCIYYVALSIELRRER